ncbi:MAG: CAAD domain-containing protein [Trichodesmium sp. MAG_R04]|nr:CAAD domain-containing protein [Trichodesmium sp. MAG_R04]
MTPTTTDVAGKTSKATPETETKISTSEATSPTNTVAETKVQKVATQIETSILDDQKPVNTVINKTIDIEQPNQTKEQLSNIFFNFPDYISKLYQEYKSQLQVFILLVLAILILILITNFIKALKEIPILSISFELIGIIYVVWFVYYYLLSQFNRQKLLDKIENIRVEILGKKS